MRYGGATSDEQLIPGGGPQGGLLTVLLFDLQVNLAGAPCPPLPLLPHGVQGPELRPYLSCHQKEDILKKKHVDDLSLLEAINLLKLVPTKHL